jgi:HEAT repeat protein
MVKLLSFITCVLIFVIGYNSSSLKSEEKTNSKIEQLIKQLDDDDWQIREKAQKELINIGAAAEEAVITASNSTDSETKLRASLILKAIGVSKRVKFSEAFIKEFPDIYQDLALSDNNAKFKLLNNVSNKLADDKIKDEVVTQDIANLIGETLLDSGKNLTDLQKQRLLDLSTGIDKELPLIPESAIHIRKLLNDQNIYVRAATAHTLAILDDRTAIPEIRKLLDNKDQYIRQSVILSLGTLGDNGVKAELKEMLNGKYPNQESLFGHIAWTMGQIEDKESLPKVMELAKSASWETRSGAVLAFGKIGTKDIIPQIMPFLKDTNEFVRGYAAISIIELGGANGIPKEIIADLQTVLKQDPHLNCKNRTRAALKILEDAKKEK